MKDKVSYALQLDNIPVQSGFAKFKVWSPDYESAFEIEVETPCKRSHFKKMLIEKMDKLIQREILQRREVIKAPALKEELKAEYQGRWITVLVELPAKKYFFEYMLPILAHSFNTVSLFCASVMAYFGLILTTEGDMAAQLTSLGIVVMSTFVSWMIFTFSTVTKDTRKLGSKMDNFVHSQWQRWRYANQKEPITLDLSNNFSEFTSITRRSLQERSNRCDLIVQGSTGVILGGMTLGTALAGGVTLYQQFLTMGAAVQEKDNPWLSDSMITALAITAVISATASVIPFQSGFAARGTEKISNCLLQWFGCRKKKDHKSIIEIESEIMHLIAEDSNSNHPSYTPNF